MRTGLCSATAALEEAGSPPVSITASGVRIHAAWNASLDAAASALNVLPYEARDRGAMLTAQVERALHHLAAMSEPSASRNRAAALQDGRCAVAAQALWTALAAAAPALTRPGASWVIEPVAGGVRIVDSMSAGTIALIARAGGVTADVPQLAAAIALLPVLMERGVEHAAAQWASVLADAWSAHEWSVGRGTFLPQDANVLWVNADTTAQLAGRAYAGGQAGACPVASTVKLACGGELWVRADAAGAQLTLVSPEGEDLHAVRIPACQLVGGVHTIEHEGLRAQLVVATGRANADGRTAVPLREVLAGGPAFGGLYNNALGMITVGDEGRFARVRAVVAGLAQPLLDEAIAVEDLGVAMGPTVLRRFQQRRESGVPAAMVLAAHEVALMRGHLAEAIDAAGGPSVSAPDAASVPVARRSVAGM